MNMKLLCISNGHGEDVIAWRILASLRQLDSTLSLSALPIAGAGNTYASADIPIIGPTQVMPSGGFLNRDPQQLGRDLQQGLLALTRSQLCAIKAWASAANGDGALLAVGDIVPLLFAYLSGLPYAFIGTAKSDYWLRDERGKLPPQTRWDNLAGWSGSVYLPWERWLMSRQRCRAVFVRDALTAQQLQRLGIAAQFAGNPMMDGLSPTGKLNDFLATISAAAPNPAATLASGDPNPATPPIKPPPKPSIKPPVKPLATYPKALSSLSPPPASAADRAKATALYVTSKKGDRAAHDCADTWLS
ncbi:MAG: hypothetical protein HC800_19490 [Phormidesmis sp. RL_2_1]|nr:hypothetical protein [Phormidesmis sp. RL_2_1]